MSQGAGEKTEKATPKKKRDAREKGEVHKSADLSSSVLICAMFGMLRAGYDGFVRSMRAFMTKFLSPEIVGRAATLTPTTLRATYAEVLLTVLPVIMPLLLGAVLCGAAVHLVQTGPMFSPAKLKPDFSKINPIQGFKRLFSSRSLMELAKSIIKVVILGWIIYKYLRGAIQSFLKLMYVDVAVAFSTVISTCISMALTIGMALVAFSVIDVLYQWWKYEKDMMMTKQEVKEEHKQTEGDPQIKGKIRQKQRRMSAMRMMRQVPQADVVITNPTHYAIALRYKQPQDRAPVVLAKGQDFLAQRIKKAAKDHKITIVENKPVARALYDACQVGDEIPGELYQAVADILIYVYKTSKQASGKGGIA
ncbi:Flagellar biosynthetic protein FlhB [bioreactor metagenome]|uniref:Flagellar biosynthetic protein FlhB n=1 Tax=bioreactor metagenome TaxID=1076179 RepID=A0A644Z5D0_9ZZZZ